MKAITAKVEKHCCEQMLRADGEKLIIGRKAPKYSGG